ncbi:response regulator [Candidatus Uhrbacteria bacterium]|nr:response regulator [Candidatus Uhrbacteria bacterium]
MKKIIIIEPDSAVREEYRELLGAEGFEVHTAVDGKAGLDLIWREQPDCVLLEILLPKIDGFEVLRRMNEKEETKDIPVVLFTELGHEEDVARARHLGAHEYCIKAHHTPQDILKKIKELLT